VSTVSGANRSAIAIREATVADARGVAEVHVEGWSWGYRGLLPDEVIGEVGVDARERQWVAAFTDDRREGDACFVAEDVAGRVVGFVACGRAADEHVRPPEGAGEVYSIYLREGVRGTGTGRALMERAHEAMAGAGFDRAVLWVLESNDPTRRFYEAAGWSWDGSRSEHRFDCGGRPIVRYARSL